MADADGIGLAAPQVHESLRIDRGAGVARSRRARGAAAHVLVNPELTPLGRGERARLRGLPVDAGPARPCPAPCAASATARSTATGAGSSGVATGLFARVLQHEVDHLDGVLYPMRMTDLRELAFTSELPHLTAWLEQRGDDAMSDALAERRALKDSVLEAALLHAAFDGWSRRTLLHAAQRCGPGRADRAAPVPAGRRQPAGLARRLGRPAHGGGGRRPSDLRTLPVRRRIALLVRTRLELLTPPSRGGAAGGRGARPARQPRRHRPGLVAHGRPDVAEPPVSAATPGEGFSYYSRRATLAGVLVAHLALLARRPVATAAPRAGPSSTAGSRT